MTHESKFIDLRPYKDWGGVEEVGKSYHKEDEIIINYYSKFPHQKRLVVDIGASDGITGSNSRKLIMEHNWEAILVEPIEKFYDFLNVLYQDFENVKIFNCACDNQEGKKNIYVNNDTSQIGLSSLIEFTNSEPQKIQTKKFNQIVSSKRVDFLSIDAEGKDYDILTDIDLNFYDIEIICIEHTLETDNRIIDYLHNFNYEKLTTAGWNWIFVKKYK